MALSAPRIGAGAEDDDIADAPIRRSSGADMRASSSKWFKAAQRYGTACNIADADTRRRRAITSEIDAAEDEVRWLPAAPKWPMLADRLPWRR